MLSDELNAKLRALADEGKDGPDFDAFGHSGKRIPYIGWFWRRVAWDNAECWLGIIPAGADDNTEPLVGFMENNKWDYPEIRIAGKTWANIRALAERVAESPSVETLRALNDAVQALATMTAKERMGDADA